MAQSIQEPSMEDILASIKRIIDEEAQPQPQAAKQRTRPIAVFPEVQATPTRDEETAGTEQAQETAIPAEPSAAPEAERDPDVLELTSPIGAPPGWQPAILSATAEQASRSAFQTLSRLQLRASETAQPATLEGLVGELLRPMLRDWLDRELPAIVERIVTAEVRRLSGQGG